jgi:hypothetical protein
LPAGCILAGKLEQGMMMSRWNLGDEETKKGCNPVKIATLEILNGAEGETRTPTRKPLLDPEPSASTNSATSATR